jgi:hypothetical protein
VEDEILRQRRMGTPPMDIPAASADDKEHIVHYRHSRSVLLIGLHTRIRLLGPPEWKVSLTRFVNGSTTKRQPFEILA